MASPIKGLTALAAYQSIDDMNQATPEERMGGTADPIHGTGGTESFGRGSRIGTPIGPNGPENQIIGEFEAWALTPAGNEYDDPQFDHTPARRAGPSPRGVMSGPIDGVSPSSIANQLQQSAILHGINTNAAAHAQRNLDATNDEWIEIDQLNPGNSDLQPIGRQAMSAGFGWGTRDRTQSFARQNEFGFDSAHQHRRYAQSPIPGNYMYLKPGGRPMVKGLPGPARPAIGPDSPFAGDDLGAAFSINGALLQNVPPEYTPPPQPTLSPSVNSDTNESVVEWY
jgi:hypothetical protein